MFHLISCSRALRSLNIGTALLCSLLAIMPSAGAIAQPGPQQSTTVEPDAVLWNTIKDVQVPSLIATFILQYPNSAYRPAAEQKLRALAASGAVAMAPAVPVGAGAVEPTRQAGAGNTASVPSADQESSFTKRSLIVNTQYELRRLGCYSGGIDAIYGPATLNAALRFMRLSNTAIAVELPSEALLDSLRRTNGRLCPVVAAIPSPRAVTQASVGSDEGPAKPQAKKQAAAGAVAPPPTQEKPGFERANAWEVFRQDSGGEAGGAGSW